MAMKYFKYDHLPEGPLKSTSKRFADLAKLLVEDLPNCSETEVALRKLFEAKDAAVRSALELVN